MSTVVNMPIQNNLTKYFLIVLIICSCTSKRVYELEFDINNYVSRQNSSFKFKLDTISSFEWDELLVAGPYTDLNEIYEYELGMFSSSIKSHDRFILLGFMLNKRGVKYVELKRDKGLDILLSGGRNGYKIFKREKTDFEIKL